MSPPGNQIDAALTLMSLSLARMCREESRTAKAGRLQGASVQAPARHGTRARAAKVAAALGGWKDPKTMTELREGVTDDHTCESSCSLERDWGHA